MNITCNDAKLLIWLRQVLKRALFTLLMQVDNTSFWNKSHVMIQGCPLPVLLGSWLRWSPPRSFPLHTFSQKSLYLWTIVNKVTCQWNHLTCTHDRIKSLSMSALLSIYLILAATILLAWGSNKCLDERAKSVCLLEDSHTGLQPKGREVAFLSVERTDAGEGV